VLGNPPLFTELPRVRLLGNLCTARRILTQWDRGKGLFHVPLNEPATTISYGGASLFRGSGVVVFSASKVGGSRGSTLLLPGWHLPPIHHLKAQLGFFIVHWRTARVKLGTFTSSTRKSNRWRRGASPPVQQVYFTSLAGARKTSGKRRLSLSAYARRGLTDGVVPEGCGLIPPSVPPTSCWSAWRTRQAILRLPRWRTNRAEEVAQRIATSWDKFVDLTLVEGGVQT
jgi:hypothetical protein